MAAEYFGGIAALQQAAVESLSRGFPSRRHHRTKGYSSFGVGAIVVAGRIDDVVNTRPVKATGFVVDGAKAAQIAAQTNRADGGAFGEQIMTDFTGTSLRRAVFLVSAVVAGLVIAGAARANAQSAESFYHGKTLRFIVPSGAGGGYDAFSRLLARHLGDHIPGNPRIVVENMPGASGLLGTNWLYSIAPRDGTVIGSTYNTLLTEPLLGNSATKYDPTKFEWIGSITTQYNACMVWHTSSIKTIEDATKREVRVSTTGLTGNSAKMPLMVNMLLGTKFKVIAGYSTTGMRLAAERGEVEGICGISYDTYAAANPEWLQDHKIRFILQSGPKPAKALPDVPLLKNYVKDPKEKAALKLLSVDEDVGRPQLMPPGVPQYLVKAMRTAFNDTMKDPKFLADAHRMHIQPAPMTGEEIEAELKEAYASPKDIVAVAAKLWPPSLPKKKKKR
jgi:tripartite-type tricarboxylate transporter receptor subunit TctC